MRQLQDLIILCSSQEEATELMDRIQQKVAEGKNWVDSSQKAASQEKSFSSQDEVAIYQIDYLNQSGQTTANLYLSHSPAGRLKVINIVPNERGELVDQFANFVMTNFKEQLLDPALDGWSKQPEVDFSKATLSPEEVLTAPIAELVENFVHWANQTGLHPNDEERWREVLIQLYAQGIELNSSELKDMLMQDFSLTEDLASKLVSQFEFSQQLLEDYDIFRRQ